MTKSELIRLKKQAAIIAKLQGKSLDELTGEFLQGYVQENIETFLEDYMKIKNAGEPTQGE